MRAWLILLGLIVLIAGHGVVLYYISSYKVVSASVLLGVVVLVVLKHVGVLVPFFAMLRRRGRR